MPLAWLEGWVERDPSLRRALLAAGAAWVATAAGLACCDLQWSYTIAVLEGHGLEGAIAAVRRELAWLTSPEPPSPKPLQVTPCALVLFGNLLATASAVALACRTAGWRAGAAALALGALAACLVQTAWYHTFTLGVLDGLDEYGHPTSGVSPRWVLALLPKSLFFAGLALVPTAGAAAALAAADWLGQRALRAAGGEDAGR